MRGKIIGQLEALDFKAMQVVKSWRREWFTPFMRALTYSGTGKAWAVIAGVLASLNFGGIVLVTEQRLFLRSMFAALLAWGLSSVLKKVFARVRPPGRIENFSHLGRIPDCGSFPSSHASASFAFFFALTMRGHPLAPWIGLWATGVTFSRCYLGVHFVSDLLGGAALGFVCSLVIVLLLPL